MEPAISLEDVDELVKLNREQHTGADTQGHYARNTIRPKVPEQLEAVQHCLCLSQTWVLSMSQAHGSAEAHFPFALHCGLQRRPVGVRHRWDGGRWKGDMHCCACGRLMLKGDTAAASLYTFRIIAQS